MECQAVFGSQFGDCGKGKTVSFLCHLSKNPLVIRFSGGQQAGHKIVIKNERLYRGDSFRESSHICSNLGSGTLQGFDTYWSKYCTLDPVGLENEFIHLDKITKYMKFNRRMRLYVDEQCPITTPYDKIANIKRSNKSKHGTCGVGVGTTLQREEDRYSLLASDFSNKSIFMMKLDLIKQYYGFKLNKAVLDEFIDIAFKIETIMHFTNGIPSEKTYSNYIFEGSQGLLLDQDIGFFPHVTRGNVGSKNILDMGYEPEVFLVTRAYQTRHGNGPMTNYIKGIKTHIKENIYEHNNSSGIQGDFRKSTLDLDLLKYAINKDEYIKNKKDKTLVITCMDLITEFKLTLKGKEYNVPYKKHFIDLIKETLQIDNVLLSYSPYHNELQQG